MYSHEKKISRDRMLLRHIWVLNDRFDMRTINIKSYHWIGKAQIKPHTWLAVFSCFTDGDRTLYQNAQFWKRAFYLKVSTHPVSSNYWLIFTKLVLKIEIYDCQTCIWNGADGFFMLWICPFQLKIEIIKREFFWEQQTHGQDV